MGTKIIRYRGDNYPIEAKLTRNGSWSLDGSTVKITIVFNDDGVDNTVTGTVTDEPNKIVEFATTSAIINSVRDGTYDIQVDDGSYIYTHLSGEISIISDITP